MKQTQQLATKATRRTLEALLGKWWNNVNCKLEGISRQPYGTTEQRWTLPYLAIGIF
jgi:hypothetical protein